MSAGEPTEAGFVEAVIHQRAGRLGGVAVAPPRLADPVADLGLLRLAGDVAYGADQFAVPLDAAHELVIADGRDPQVSVDQRIGVRNTRRHARDVPVASQHRNAAGVAGIDWAIRQTLRAHTHRAPTKGAGRAWWSGRSVKKGDVATSPFQLLGRAAA